MKNIKLLSIFFIILIYSCDKEFTSIDSDVISAENAIDFSDAIILGSQEIPKEVSDHLNSSKKPVLDYQTRETFSETYTEFYKNEVLNQ